MSEEQLQSLKNLLLHKSPTEYGYNTETWTGPMLIEWLKGTYSIVYRKAQIYNIIKSLGFTYQKAKGYYPETDLLAQEEFKETLKKTSRKSS